MNLIEKLSSMRLIQIGQYASTRTLDLTKTLTVTMVNDLE
ncbi:MAG: hypothetical protein BWY45_01855 [Euryarchaeota archaeon ADurb.Bin294]|nr:MAG: hypothetical protein BWY45_01855 [Euryarchaeota archaeon ADurb.Bin294]